MISWKIIYQYFLKYSILYDSAKDVVCVNIIDRFSNSISSYAGFSSYSVRRLRINHDIRKVIPSYLKDINIVNIVNIAIS